MIKNELKFLFKHTSIYGIGTVVGQAVSFLLLPVYTRYLTPSDYGIMALVNATMGIIGIVVGLGINSAMSRFYFDFDDDKARKKVISTVYLITVMVVLLAFPFFYFSTDILSEIVFHTRNYALLFLIASSALLLGMVVNVCVEYIRVIAASSKYVTITFIRMCVVIGFNIFFIVVQQTGVIGIFYSSLISALIFSIILSFDLLRQVGLSFSFSLSLEMIKYSFPLIFSNIFRVIVNESDKYFINYFFSPWETGLFSLAQKVGSSIHTLITSPFVQTYMPRRFEIMKKKDAKQVYAHVSFYYLLIISTIGLVLSIFSPEIIKLMTTKDYFSATKYIPFIVLSLVVFGMKYHFQIGIMIHKKTKIIAYINACSTVVNILLNWILIRHYGIWGAIISINVAYGVITILDYIYSQKIYPIRYDFIKMFKILAVSSFIYFLSTLVGEHHVVVSILLKGGILVGYVFLLFLTRVIGRREFKPVATALSARLGINGAK